MTNCATPISTSQTCKSRPAPPQLASDTDPKRTAADAVPPVRLRTRRGPRRTTWCRYSPRAVQRSGRPTAMSTESWPATGATRRSAPSTSSAKIASSARLRSSDREQVAALPVSWTRCGSKTPAWSSSRFSHEVPGMVVWRAGTKPRDSAGASSLVTSRRAGMGRPGNSSISARRSPVLDMPRAPLPLRPGTPLWAVLQRLA
jgi:hypothetical protein